MPLLHPLREAASPRSVWLAASMLYRGDDRRRLARLAAMADGARVPLIAVNDVLYHAPEAAHAAGRRHLHPRARARSIRPAGGSKPMPSATSNRRPKWRGCCAPCRRRSNRPSHFLDRCRFSLDELRKTEYPDETRQGFATPQDALVAFAEEGVGAALSGWHPAEGSPRADGRTADRRRARLRAFFPHRGRDRQIRTRSRRKFFARGAARRRIR